MKAIPAGPAPACAAPRAPPARRQPRRAGAAARRRAAAGRLRARRPPGAAATQTRRPPRPLRTRTRSPLERREPTRALSARRDTHPTTRCDGAVGGARPQGAGRAAQRSAQSRAACPCLPARTRPAAPPRAPPGSAQPRRRPCPARLPALRPLPLAAAQGAPHRPAALPPRRAAPALLGWPGSGRAGAGCRAPCWRRTAPGCWSRAASRAGPGRRRRRRAGRPPLRRFRAARATAAGAAVRAQGRQAGCDPPRGRRRAGRRRPRGSACAAAAGAAAAARAAPAGCLRCPTGARFSRAA